MIRVTTEFADVLLRPFHSPSLILEPDIQATVLLNLLGSEKSECTTSVGDGNNDKLVTGSFDQARGVLVRSGSLETTALNIKVDWQLRVWRGI